MMRTNVLERQKRKKKAVRPLKKRNPLEDEPTIKIGYTSKFFFKKTIKLETNKESLCRRVLYHSSDEDFVPII